LQSGLEQSAATLPIVNDYLTVSEAAAELGVTAVAIRARLKRGVMHGVKRHERLWLISRDEVNRWLEKGKSTRGRKRNRPSSA